MLKGIGRLQRDLLKMMDSETNGVIHSSDICNAFSLSSKIYAKRLLQAARRLCDRNILKYAFYIGPLSSDNVISHLTQHELTLIELHKKLYPSYNHFYVIAEGFFHADKGL